MSFGSFLSDELYSASRVRLVAIDETNRTLWPRRTKKFASRPTIIASWLERYLAPRRIELKSIGEFIETPPEYPIDAQGRPWLFAWMRTWCRALAISIATKTGVPAVVPNRFKVAASREMCQIHLRSLLGVATPL